MSSRPAEGERKAGTVGVPIAMPIASMTGRLTLLFTVAVSLVLFSVSLLLHWRLAESLQGEDEAILRENLEGLRVGLESPEALLPILERKIAVEVAAVRHEPYYLRHREGGRTIAESPGMARLLPSDRFGAPAPEGEGRIVQWRSPEGRLYLLLAERFAGGVHEAALDRTHDDLLMRHYRRDLLLTVFTGILLAALAGVWIARRGLRPLARMAGGMREITAGRLDRRIGGADWPRELADLARVFDAMLGRLEDSFHRLTRYSGDLAHEIRTPLTNLRAEAEVALHRARSPEEYRDVLASSLEEYDRLTELVDRLLFLARADAGSTAVELTPLDARAEGEAVLDFFSAEAEEKGVLLTCEGEGELHADPFLLRRALVNLVANALAHTSAGGTIRIEVRREERGTRIAVADTGSGIPPDHLPHVAERFYRVPASDESGAVGAGARAGTGLGLSLVGSILALHRGEFRIESGPGRGTRVILEFPHPRSAPPVPAPRSRPPSSPRPAPGEMTSP